MFKYGGYMIRHYMDVAMSLATYEKLDDDGVFYGDIQVCPGVYATGNTKEECRKNLEEVLEEWILVRVYRRLAIPAIDGIHIEVKAGEVA